MTSEKISSIDNKLVILYTTVNSLKVAESLAKEVALARLAACINIIPGIQSIYWEQENLKSAVECVMIFKTTPNFLPKLEKWLLENHPYDVPAILKWDVASSAAFCEYVSSSVH